MRVYGSQCLFHELIDHSPLYLPHVVISQLELLQLPKTVFFVAYKDVIDLLVENFGQHLDNLDRLV